MIRPKPTGLFAASGLPAFAASFLQATLQVSQRSIIISL
jgi:hypothetical protein